jgi:ACT domain-containing protein
MARKIDISEKHFFCYKINIVNLNALLNKCEENVILKLADRNAIYCILK